MKTYKIIGNMTGNSMDAIDLVLTEFKGDQIKDVCFYTVPYIDDMRQKMAYLRKEAYQKTRTEIEKIPEFYKIHDDYISGIAKAIDRMCVQNGIDQKTIDAIGFHGKTLDHNPPSKAKADGTLPYTLQIGSGQMLADLTKIPVVYDFRSDLIIKSFEGAPLVAPHNAHIALTEGDGCYYNGGNTSNFAIIEKGKAKISSDAGPFNEYTDCLVRLKTSQAFDKDGAIGKKGKLNQDLLQTIFDFGRDFYEKPLPKSGDPAYYHKKEIFEYVKQNKISLEDAVKTFEYSAAYVAAYTFSLLPKDIIFVPNFILFGGGWKNPVVFESFEKLISGQSFILKEHEECFENLRERFVQKPKIKISLFGDYMEARLMADLARYKLENKAWEIPEVMKSGQKIVCGKIAIPNSKKLKYDDCINRAAKGFQNEAD